MKDIKTLLMLSSIPGFKMTKEEEEYLDKWKSEQVVVKPKKPRSKASKTHSNASLDTETVKVSTRKRIKNIIEKEDRVLNEIKIEGLEEES